jgi:hypothetical protein
VLGCSPRFIGGSCSTAPAIRASTPLVARSRCRAGPPSGAVQVVAAAVDGGQRQRRQHVAGRSVAGLLQGHHQLVDLLVLLLHLPGQRLPVGEQPAQGGPQHRLLGEGVAEHQTVHPLQHVVLLLAAGPSEPVQQVVQLDVVALLPHQDAHGSTQLGVRLLRDRPHAGSWVGLVRTLALPDVGHGMRPLAQ